MLGIYVKKIEVLTHDFVLEVDRKIKMVEAVVSFAVERLHDLLTEEARLLIGVSDKVKRMQNELKRMQCFLRDAERKQDKNDTIKNYISEVRKLAYDAEDVIEIYAIKVALGISVGTKNPLAKTKHLHKVGTEQYQ